MQGLLVELTAKVKQHGWLAVLCNCYAICFGITMLVAVGLVVTAVVKADWFFAAVAGAVFCSAFMGFAIPLYPAGVATFAVAGTLGVAMAFYGDDVTPKPAESVQELRAKVVRLELENAQLRASAGLVGLQDLSLIHI